MSGTDSGMDEERENPVSRRTGPDQLETEKRTEEHEGDDSVHTTDAGVKMGAEKCEELTAVDVKSSFEQSSANRTMDGTSTSRNIEKLQSSTSRR